VPRALIDQQVQDLQLDTARRLGIRDVAQLPPREGFEEPARRRAALSLLISQIVQAEELKVERARVQERLGELVESYPDPEQARRAYLQNRDAMGQIEAAALEEQVIDWVLARARVSERPMTFTELTGFGQGGQAHEHEHEAHAAGAGGQQQQEQVSGS
jgi:trigger factor